MGILVHSTPLISLFGTTHLLSEVIIFPPFDKTQLFLVIFCLVSFSRLRLFRSSGFVCSHVFVSSKKQSSINNVVLLDFAFRADSTRPLGTLEAAMFD